MTKDICIDYCESTICDGCRYKDASDVERMAAFYNIIAEELDKSNQEQAERCQKLGLEFY